jgi:hypothetical protein
MGYQLVPDQSSDYWQINPQGFAIASRFPLKSQSMKSAFLCWVIPLPLVKWLKVMMSSGQTALKICWHSGSKNKPAAPEKFKPLEAPYFADEVAKIQLLPPRIQRRYLSGTLPQLPLVMLLPMSYLCWCIR